MLISVRKTLELSAMETTVLRGMKRLWGKRIEKIQAAMKDLLSKLMEDITRHGENASQVGRGGSRKRCNR